METSYFGAKKNDPRAVSIARGNPRGFKGRKYLPLAPSWELIKITDEKEYTERYRKEVLNLLDPRQVVEDLREDAILLCWEKPDKFCHRRLVAEWFQEELGIKVPEIAKL